MATWYYVVGSSSYNYLTTEQKQSNALLLMSKLKALGWTDIAIAGLFGNIDYEGIFNPGQCEVDYGVPSGNDDTSYDYGLGLIQWTKPSGATLNPLLHYAGDNNKNWYDGDLQAEYLDHADDYSYTYGDWGWIQKPQYPISFQQYKQLNTTPTYAAYAWVYNLERPSDPESSGATRAANAEQWYTFIQQNSYVPRLDYVGTDTLPYYREYNAYFGYDSEGDWIGLNNCTAYAFGRWNELARVTSYNTNWPVHDGADWVSDGIAKGYQSGNVPQLGAAISWKKIVGGELVSNHVAIVEEIQYDGNGNPVSFTISQSAFNGGRPAPDTGERGPTQRGYNYFPWFWTDTVYMNNLDYVYGSGSFQGFLYHPSIIPTPTPSPATQGRKMPFIFYLRNMT